MTSTIGERLARGFGAVVVAVILAGGVQAAEVRPGVALGAEYVQDYFRVLSGGLHQRGGGPGVVHLSADMDGRAWNGSTDNRFHLDLLGIFGGSITDQVGDLQGVDNNEASTTARLFEAWYEHAFTGSGVTVRLGMQDFNALFDTVDAAGVFINSSFGLDPTISQLPVSTFPENSVGGVLRWQSQRGLYAMGGVFDGTPGRPNHYAGTHVRYHDGDGLFSVVEVGLEGSGDRSYKLGVGGWYRTTDFEDSGDRAHDNNHGLYLIGQKRLLGGDSRPAVDAFVQLGTAEKDRNDLDRYVGAGVTVTGLIPGRGDDVLGLGMARAYASSVLRRATADPATAETTLEATYQMVATERLMLQPDLQYVIHPGASRATDNALVLGIRADYAW